MARSRRAVILGAFWIAGTAAIAGVGVSGCFGHNCDDVAKEYGHAPNEGRMIDENTWESTPIDEPWLDFPRQRLWLFDLRLLGDRKPQTILPYVSAQKDPLKNGSFTIGSGNIAELSGVDNGRVAVRNGTCADYFLHVVVVAQPFPPGAGDAGAPDAADASAPDAEADAAADADTDAEAGP